LSEKRAAKDASASAWATRIAFALPCPSPLSILPAGAPSGTDPFDLKWLAMTTKDAGADRSAVTRANS
jgi:hypothetical protein